MAALQPTFRGLFIQRDSQPGPDYGRTCLLLDHDRDERAGAISYGESSLATEIGHDARIGFLTIRLEAMKRLGLGAEKRQAAAEKTLKRLFENGLLETTRDAYYDAFERAQRGPLQLVGTARPKIIRVNDQEVLDALRAGRLDVRI